MVRWLSSRHGDPSRIHAEGMAARVAIEESRERIAEFFGARSREVVFTSGATEAIASATWGAAERGRRIVVSPVEHSAVREASDAFARSEGGEVVTVEVDSQGRVDVDALSAAVSDDVALVHVQWGNHEVGTLQPVAEIVERCHERDVLVHVDTAQGNGHVPFPSTSAPPEQTSCRSVGTSSARRRASERCSFVVGSASGRCSSAVTRNAHAGPASRTFLPSSVSPPHVPHWQVTRSRPNRNERVASPIACWHGPTTSTASASTAIATVDFHT
jgi:hypothetical protein